jgi:hypothetical protein
MRKRLTLTLALAVATATALVASAFGVPTAPDGNTQTIRVEVSPRKLPKKQLAPAVLSVKTRTTSTTDPNGVPVPATRAFVDFDRGISLFTRGVPRCDAGKLQNTSTRAALALCGKAKVGAGNATVLLRVGEQVFIEKAAVTAFNGKPKGRHPVVLLHSFARSPVQVTLVLVGTVRNYRKQGFGTRLDISIPLLAGGSGAIASVEVAIRKKFRFRNRLRSYVEARCLTKRFKSRGKFVFLDGQALTDHSVQRCVQR